MPLPTTTYITTSFKITIPNLVNNGKYASIKIHYLHICKYLCMSKSMCNRLGSITKFIVINLSQLLVIESDFQITSSIQCN